MTKERHFMKNFRFKFPSFYISWEEHERECHKRVKLYEERGKKQAKEIK